MSRAVETDMSFAMPHRLKLTIGIKIYALIGLSFLGLIGLTAFNSRELAAGLKQQKQLELRHLTELALGIFAEEHAAAQKGTISVAEAQKRALERASQLRYGGNEYFFVTDMTAKMLMHPISTKLVGQDVADMKDPNGKKLFIEMIDVVRQHGRGFVDYDWPKPGSETPQPKLTHVAGFAPWNWLVGTGVYIDDLSAQAWASTRQSLTAAGIVLLILLVVSTLVGRGITNPLHRMTSAMKSLAGGRLDVEVPGVGRGDEIGEMAGAVEVFKSNAVARHALEAEQKEAEQRALARQGRHAQDGRRLRKRRWRDRRDGLVGFVQAGSVGGHVEQDGGPRRRARNHGGGRVGGSVHQRAIRRLGHRGDDVLGHRDRPPGA